MTLALILNVILAAAVLVSIVGLLAHSIRSGAAAARSGV
jgi:hypothetical protein